MLFLPQVIALVVVAVMWRMIYAPDGGPLNQVLRAVGLGGLGAGLARRLQLALPSVGLIGTWVMYGLAMVLFTAGVQKIPQSLYDAARMDGAGPVREFFAVTLPGLRNEIAVVLTLTTIQALRSFDSIYITTGGGPGDATTVPAYVVYSRAFQSGEVGSAAAIGDHAGADIFVVTVGINRIAERGDAMNGRREQALTYVLLGVFSLIALVPIVGHPAHRAAGRRAGRRASASPTACTSRNYSKAWSRAASPRTCRSSVIVGRRGGGALDAAVGPGRVRVRDDALPRRPGALLPVPARADGADRGDVVPLYYDVRASALTDTYSALILPQVGGLGRVRDVLDARVVPAACRARWSRRRGSTAPPAGARCGG